MTATKKMRSPASGEPTQDSGPSVDPTFMLKDVPAPLIYPAQPLWLGIPSDRGGGKSTIFKKEIDIAAPDQNTFIFITACKSFDLKVNGKKIGSSPFRGKNNKFGWKQTHMYNIGRYLKPGRNVIAVRVRSFKYTKADSSWLATSDKKWVKGGLIARIQTTSQFISWTDSSWQVQNGKEWTAAEELGSPSLTKFIDDDDDILNAWPDYFPESPDYIRHLTLKPIHIEAHGVVSGTDSITVDSSKLSEGQAPFVILDFGKEIGGRLVLKSDQMSVADIAVGESLEELNSPYHDGQKIVTTKGGTSSTDYTAFRYAKISFPVIQGMANVKTYTEMDIDHDFYPVEYGGSFECSDPRLTKIWYTGAYTAHLCMQFGVLDGPKRDRGEWMGDIGVSGKVIDDVFGDTFLMEKSLTDLRTAAQGTSAPGEPPQKHVNGFSGYSCAWISALADFHRHQGDLGYLSSQKSNLISMLEYLQKDLDDRGVFANLHKADDFVDWAPGLEDDSPQNREDIHFTLLKAVNDAVFMFQELGDSEKTQYYQALAENLKASGHKIFFDQASNTFGPYRQVNAMAVLSGTPSGSDGENIYEKILQPSSPAWKAIATPYYNYYVLEAMAELGHYDGALEVIRSYWGGMLDLGATTFWEAYDPSWPKEHFHDHLKADDGEGTFVSLAHGWSAGPTAWLTENVLGIRPKTGGFKSVEISPHLEDLQWASGSVPTPHGILSVKVEKKDKGLRVNLTLPAGIHAKVILPGEKPGESFVREIEAPGSYQIESP